MPSLYAFGPARAGFPSYFTQELGPGRVFCVNGTFILREHAPACEWTGLPVVECPCPDHEIALRLAEAAA